MSYILLIFLPLVLSGVIYFFTRHSSTTKYIALTLFICMLLCSAELYTLLPQSGYLALANILHILVTLSSWSIKNQAAYFSLLIFFSGAIFGVFMSTNLLWFFIFWELTLIPMYFLVGIWGAERRVYAAVKFFLYTHVASMFILLAFFLIYKQSGTFDMTLVKDVTLATPALIWWLLFIGFAVKMPLFPFHTWLPDAHVQAPAPVSALLAGVLLKMGAYAMIRMVILMLPLEAQKYAWVILALGVITLLYSAFMALYTTHMKKMVAYSSISHMGLVAIAISTLSFSGLSSALYEMISHAFIISPLFLITGFFHQKTQSWQMEDMGGIMQKAPYLSAIFIFAGLGALGLPSTMGFIGEITILISSLQKYGAFMAIIALASILSASYIIWSFRRIIYAQMSALVIKNEFHMGKAEFLALIIFAILILLFGLYPQPLFTMISQAFSPYFTGGAL